MTSSVVGACVMALLFYALPIRDSQQLVTILLTVQPNKLSHGQRESRLKDFAYCIKLKSIPGVDDG